MSMVDMEAATDTTIIFGSKTGNCGLGLHNEAVGDVGQKKKTLPS